MLKSINQIYDTEAVIEVSKTSSNIGEEVYFKFKEEILKKSKNVSGSSNPCLNSYNFYTDTSLSLGSYPKSGNIKTYGLTFTEGSRLPTLSGYESSDKGVLGLLTYFTPHNIGIQNRESWDLCKASLKDMFCIEVIDSSNLQASNSGSDIDIKLEDEYYAINSAEDFIDHALEYKKQFTSSKNGYVLFMLTKTNQIIYSVLYTPYHSHYYPNQNSGPGSLNINHNALLTAIEKYRDSTAETVQNRIDTTSSDSNRFTARYSCIPLNARNDSTSSKKVVVAMHINSYGIQSVWSYKILPNIDTFVQPVFATGIEPLNDNIKCLADCFIWNNDMRFDSTTMSARDIFNIGGHVGTTMAVKAYNDSTYHNMAVAPGLVYNSASLATNYHVMMEDAVVRNNCYVLQNNIYYGTIPFIYSYVNRKVSPIPRETIFVDNSYSDFNMKVVSFKPDSYKTIDNNTFYGLAFRTL